MGLWRRGPKTTTGISCPSPYQAKFYRITIFKTQISFFLTCLASTDLQVGRHRLLGGPGCCRDGRHVLRENQTNASKTISSFRKGFWNSGFLLGNHYNGKITPVCSSDAGSNQRVEQILICSHQPPPSISRDVMMQVFCLTSSFHWPGTLSCDKFFKRAQFPLRLL